jgi:ribosomal protein S27E
VNIKNKGTASDDFDIAYTYNQSLLEVTGPSSTGSIAKDSSSEIQVTVKVAHMTEPRQEKIAVEVTSPAPNAQSLDVVETLELLLNIEQKYEVALYCADKSMETGDDTTAKYRIVEYTVECVNEGTAYDDTIKLEIDSEPADFDVELEYELLKLEAGESGFFKVTVKVDDDEPVGSETIKIKAVTQGNASSYDESDVFDTVTLTTDISQIYDYTFEISSPSSGIQKGSVGETVDYTLKVKNEGNDVDTFTYKIIGDTQNWATLSTLTKAINPSQEGTVTLSVSIPSDNKDAQASDYYFDVQVTSEDKVTVKTVQAKLEIDESIDFEVRTTDDQNSKSLLPAESHTYSLQIKNKGNAEDTFTLAKTGEKTEWIKFMNGSDSITLGAGDSGIVYVTISIPDLEDLDDPDKVAAGLYTQTITVTSNNDDTKEKTYDFLTTVKQLYSIEMTEDTSGLEIDANNRDGTEYKFTVRNTGNKQDTIKLEADTQSGVNIVFSSSTVTLGTNSEKSVSCTITLLTTFKANTVYFTITGTPGNGQKSKYKEEIDVTGVMVHKPDLTITQMTHDNDDWYALKSDKWEWTITVANNGTEDVENVKVEIKTEGKTYTKTIDAIDAGSTVDVEFDWTVEKTKTKQTITVKVDPSNNMIEESDNNNELKTRTISKDTKGEDDPPVSWVYIALAGIIGLLVGAIVVGLFMRQGIIPTGAKDEIQEQVEKKHAGPKTKKVAGGGAGARGPRSKALAKGRSEKPSTAGKKVKIQCPNCEEIMVVTSPKRPINVDCKGCGKKLVLTK